MNEQKEPMDYGGCFAQIVENGVFLLGAVLMFSKTVDLMSAFAPRSFMGYVGVESFYGLAVGLMVEGMLVALKISLGKPKNVLEWGWNIMLIVAPFIISAFAQVFDSFIVRETLDKQPAEVQWLVTWGVPSIPTLIVGLFVGKSILASIPEDMFRRMPKAVRPVSEVTVSRSNTGMSIRDRVSGLFGNRRVIVTPQEEPVSVPPPASIEKK